MKWSKIKWNVCTTHSKNEGLFFASYLELIYGNLIYLRTKKTFWITIFGLALDSYYFEVF